MINKKIPMDLLAKMQILVKKGLLTVDEKQKIADACRKYAASGDDDELYEFLTETRFVCEEANVILTKTKEEIFDECET